MTGHPGLQRRITTFSTDQDAATILAFYRQQLAASGWAYACDGHVPGCGWGQLSGSLSHAVYRRPPQATAGSPTFEVIIMPTAASSLNQTSVLLYETRAH